MRRTTDAAILFRGASVGYGRRTILGPLDLEVPRGRITTLIGPNGAGKSTLLKTVTRELPLLSGDVELFGKDLHSYSPKELASVTAAVLTERIHPELLTCRDIVAVGRYPYTGAFGVLTEEDERKIDQALADVHAEEIADRDFTQISDGQKQRILLARALCQEPDLLILDEPTSYLDIKYKLDLLTVLQKMTRDRGMTVVMSLHEIDLAQKVSDLVVCVGKGGLFKVGTPEEVFQKSLIQDLYGMENGFYDAMFGSVEFLESDRTDGTREVNPSEGSGATVGTGVSGSLEGAGQSSPAHRVVVLSMGGAGIPVYRRLQKLGIAFSAGLLSELDVDYHLAREIADSVTAIPAFTPVTEAQLSEVKEAIDGADRVIGAGCPDDMNRSDALKELEEYSRRRGKLASPEEFFHGA